MEGLGVEEVARWLVDTLKLPQYEQAFRENCVDGYMLLDLVSRDILVHLVENPLHQSRIRAALTASAHRAAAAQPPAGDAAAGDARGTRRAAPDDERPAQRRRLDDEPATAGTAPAAAAIPAAAASLLPLTAVESPVHGMLVYPRPPLTDLEVCPPSPRTRLRGSLQYCPFHPVIPVHSIGIFELQSVCCAD